MSFYVLNLNIMSTYSFKIVTSQKIIHYILPAFQGLNLGQH